MKKSVRKIDDELLSDVEAACVNRGLTCKLRNSQGIQVLTITNSLGEVLKFKAPVGTRGQGWFELNGRRYLTNSVWSALNVSWGRSNPGL